MEDEYFSITRETIYLLLEKRPEELGYSLRERSCPEISVGKGFNPYLWENKLAYPNKFPTIKRRLSNGRQIDQKQYPNKLWSELKIYFHEIWLPEKSSQYFISSDPEGAPFIEKLQEAANDSRFEIHA